MASDRKDIGALTGIRGVAAVWVAVYHFWFQQPWPHTEQTAGPKALLAHGYLAVDLFFILSGFVMAMSYGHLFENINLRRYGVFLTRRFARVYPLYFSVSIAFIAYLSARQIESFTARELVSNLFMIQSWGLGRSIVNQSWSLSVELLSYLIFPALFAILCKTRWNTASIAFSLCTCVIAYIATTSHVVPVEYRGDLLNVSRYSSVLPILRCVAEFSIGIFVYRVSTHPRFKHFADRDLLATAATLLLIALASFYRLDVAFVLCAAAVVFFMSGDNLPARLLGTSALLVLGDLSYALYLVHSEIIDPIGKIFQNSDFFHRNYLFACFSTYAVIAFFSSWVLHRAVERPGRRILRRLEFVFNKRAETMVRQSESRGIAEVSEHAGRPDTLHQGDSEGASKTG